MSEAMENFCVVLLAVRKKLTILVALIALGMMVSFEFTGLIIEKMRVDLLPEGAKLIYVTPLEVMMLQLKLSVLIGVLLVLPLVIYYIYRALQKRFAFKNPLGIKRSSLIFLVGAVIFMFVLGSCYAYFFMLPLFLKYLYLSSAGVGVTATYSIFSFISFAAATVALFGLTFELPIILTVLTRQGIVKYETLVTYRRHIYVLILIVDGFITPGPDVFSQVMVSVPMIIFFEISLLIVRVLGVRKKALS